MPEIPPDNSIVAIKSYRYGTYVTACPDHKSVILQKVEDPNKLPPNCLWTLRQKPLFGYPIGSLRFISCYRRHLSSKGYVWKEICQDNPITAYNRLGFAGWTYDRVGTTDRHEGFRLMIALSGHYLCARENGELCLDFNLFYLSTEPEVYWTIHRVDNNSDAQLVPAIPQPLRSSDAHSTGAADDDDLEHGRGCKGIMIRVAVPIYNNPMAINTGGNVNQGRGQQQNGEVNAGNTLKQYG
ncbi:hypothetical protein vseg_018320 [Gypsophila vaccaria]